jgi:peptidoglycan/xylan/chitin deacetylase (PgdA/CDA1 family)
MGLSNTEKKVYLTFDDGPTPKVTEWVLEKLDQHSAKATFFALKKYRSIPIYF